MKTLSFASIAALVREVFHAFIGIAAGIIAALMRMPLPRLLLVCVIAAAVVAVLPLAVTLFFFALAIKLIAAVVVLASRRDKPQLEHHGDKQ
jgi:hypothetical protein